MTIREYGYNFLSRFVCINVLFALHKLQHNSNLNRLIPQHPYRSVTRACIELDWNVFLQNNTVKTRRLSRGRLVKWLSKMFLFQTNAFYFEKYPMHSSMCNSLQVSYNYKQYVHQITSVIPMCIHTDRVHFGDKNDLLSNKWTLLWFCLVSLFLNNGT